MRSVFVLPVDSTEMLGSTNYFCRGVGRKIFWKHLFPPREDAAREFGPSRPIACPQTRGWLMELIFTLVKDDPTQLMWLLEDMDDMVPVYPAQEGWRCRMVCEMSIWLIVF